MPNMRQIIVKNTKSETREIIFSETATIGDLKSALKWHKVPFFRVNGQALDNDMVIQKLPDHAVLVAARPWKRSEVTASGSSTLPKPAPDFYQEVIGVLFATDEPKAPEPEEESIKIPVAKLRRTASEYHVMKRKVEQKDLLIDRLRLDIDLLRRDLLEARNLTIVAQQRALRAERK